MKIIFAIGLGSFIGGIGRYLLSIFIQNKTSLSFPFGTLVVNILGCFLIGIVYGMVQKGTIPEEWRLFFATGILGGFTTFSAFSYETVFLIRNVQYINAALYISLSILLGLLATFVGLTLLKTA